MAPAGKSLSEVHSPRLLLVLLEGVREWAVRIRRKHEHRKPFNLHCRRLTTSPASYQAGQLLPGPVKREPTRGSWRR